MTWEKPYYKGWQEKLLWGNEFSLKSESWWKFTMKFVGQWKQYRRRQWHPTPVLLPGRSHGQRSLVGCSPWGRDESDTTEWFHFSLSHIEEGNGNPLQYSCLENPRDRGTWWAAIYGVAQSRTWLKWLSSSSSNRKQYKIIIIYWLLWKKHCNPHAESVTENKNKLSKQRR